MQHIYNLPLNPSPIREGLERVTSSSLPSLAGEGLGERL
jgi:hypothetical protein